MSRNRINDVAASFSAAGGAGADYRSSTSVRMYRIINGCLSPVCSESFSVTTRDNVHSQIIPQSECLVFNYCD